MTKLVFAAVATGAAALLTSCEPLPSYPPPGYQPNSGMYGSQGRLDPYGPRTAPPNRDSRYGGRVDPDADNNPYGFRQPPTRPEPSGPTPTPKQTYPSAERTDNPNQVISPYAPYNVIDVEGFRAGQLAKDPSNGKIFRVP